MPKENIRPLILVKISPIVNNFDKDFGPDHARLHFIFILNAYIMKRYYKSIYALFIMEYNGRESGRSDEYRYFMC